MIGESVENERSSAKKALLMGAVLREGKVTTWGKRFSLQNRGDRNISWGTKAERRAEFGAL